MTVVAGFVLPVLAEDCEEHWVSGISDCGQIVQLDNRTSWRVHSMDTAHAAKWHLGDSVQLCRKVGTMKNLDLEASRQIEVHVKPTSWFSQLNDSDVCPFERAPKKLK
ncbi:MAG: hypothetical protein AB7J37_05035 [Candidatus Melainabacteria bacterium]